MNEGKQRIPTTNFVVKMDEQRRIDIDRPIIESTLGVKISTGQPLRFWAMVGARRQIQVLAPTNELAKTRERFEAGILKEHPTWDSANDERTDLIRRITSFLTVSCASEPKRRKLRLTVDVEAERLGLIQPRANLVVFAAGEILELWRYEAWVENSSFGDLRDLESRVKEAFSENS